MHDGRGWLRIAALALGGATLVAAWQAQALPRYAARYEQNCALCHVNPTGGGMRTSYASRELVPDELAWNPAGIRGGEALDPAIGRNLTIGADFRQIFLGADADAPRHNFFQMQGDVYLSFQLDPRAVLVFERGLSNTYEVYGVLQPRSWLYLKSGRFAPAYGWKFDDHTHAVRRDLGFEPPAHSDVGIEVGFQPAGFEAQVALLNGNRGSTSDRDRDLAFAGSALARFRAGPLGLGLGASGWIEPGAAADRGMAGGRGYATLGRLTWLGEGDWFRVEPATGPAAEGVASSHEFSFALRPGLDLLATWDFFDPDLEVASGARSRYGAGLHLMPRPWVTLDARVRTMAVDPGPAVPERDQTEVVLQLHLLY